MRWNGCRKCGAGGGRTEGSWWKEAERGGGKEEERRRQRKGGGGGGGEDSGHVGKNLERMEERKRGTRDTPKPVLPGEANLLHLYFFLAHIKLSKGAGALEHSPAFRQSSSAAGLGDDCSESERDGVGKGERERERERKKKERGRKK